MPKIEFYDLAKKKSFMSDKFKIVKKNNRSFAVATSPSGNKTMRIVSKEFARKFKK